MNIWSLQNHIKGSVVMMTQGITALGDPHNTPALDGFLTQEGERRDISTALQRLSVLSPLLALIMLLSPKKSFQKISSMARIFELKSVKNMKLTSLVYLIRSRKLMWSPFSPKWCGSWWHEQLPLSISRLLFFSLKVIQYLFTSSSSSFLLFYPSLYLSFNTMF